MREVYVDNGATTEIDPKVLKVMMPYLEDRYGNASSTHSRGMAAKQAVDGARKTIADSIKPLFARYNMEELMFFVPEPGYCFYIQSKHFLVSFLFDFVLSHILLHICKHPPECQIICL